MSTCVHRHYHICPREQTLTLRSIGEVKVVLVRVEACGSREVAELYVAMCVKADDLGAKRSKDNSFFVNVLQSQQDLCAKKSEMRERKRRVRKEE